MELFYSELKDDLIDFSLILQTTLNDALLFLKEVSKVYSSIGEKFPALENEIQKENDNAMNIINYFLSEKKDDSDNFSVLLKKNQDEFFDTLKHMQNFIDLDKGLAESIASGVLKVDNVVGSIEQIKRLADQIKIYSLNAVVTSSKYGVKGRAFGEISKNIIKLSDDSNQEAEHMSRVGKELFNKFEFFQKQIETINHRQEQGFISVGHDISGAFGNVLEAFNDFSKILSDVIERVDGTKFKIFDVMTSLQREDIIRQQTEHIIESIEMLVQEDSDLIEALTTLDTEEGRIEHVRQEIEHKVLNILTFSDVVFSLIMHNFDDIAKEIASVNDFIKQTLIDMKTQIQDIASDKDVIVEHFIGDDSGKHFNVSDYIFNQYTSCMRDYIESINKLLQEKDNVAEKNNDIDDIIDSLEGMFNQTRGIANTFNSINFLAKIELEKNEDVFENSQTFSVKNVEAIATNITRTVEQCLEEFEVIKVDLFSSLDNFKNNMKDQKDVYSTMQTSVDYVEKRLIDSKDTINENIKVLDHYSVDLTVLIDRTISDMDFLSTLVSEINTIADIYRHIVERMKARKEAAYMKFGVDTWKLEDEKFLKIINSYTIEKERAIADSVLSESGNSMDIDVGFTDNDVIFF